MASQREDVYATLLLNDNYLPGALVLAHSLRDAGTSKKLAVLVTTDSVSVDVIAELQKLFDFVIPVERVDNHTPANLYLMDRADLQSTFTKITLWKQTQFRRIVYVDADMVALRAPDELFDLPHPFSAAPDIGWPDLFNTGLMVLNPNMGDYYALLAMAQRGISFDGADQGLLNMHFKNTFNRLSFTYNVTPSAHYQYLPAYRHFQSSISMAHFIGQKKPWTEGRDAHKGSTPYDEMVGRWWAVYDRHFRRSVHSLAAPAESSLSPQPAVDSSPPAVPLIVQYHTKGEFQPVTPIVSTPQIQVNYEAFQPPREEPRHEPIWTPQQVEEAYVPPVETNWEKEQKEHKEHKEHEEHKEHKEHWEHKEHGEHKEHKEHEEHKEHKEQKETEVHYEPWDARRAPPPADSRPEASNFPVTHYEFVSDPTPFIAPARYPDPPKDMYYEVPKTPTYQKPTPIFPWEKDAPKPTRVFPDDIEEVAPEPKPSSSEPLTAPPEKDEIVTPAPPIIQPPPPSDPWQSYTRGNAWDDIPEIERYIGRLQRNRKGNIQILQGYGSGRAPLFSQGVVRRHSMKLTDFPTELERPSLPVTPAPVRRPSFWGKERDGEGQLPAAEGVPSQEEWDPSARLEQLARRQSDVLKRDFGSDGLPKREIPMRPLPYGSEGVTSPTYVAQAPKSGGASGSEPKPEGAASATDVAQAPRSASGSEPKPEEVSSATSVAQVPKNGGASGSEQKSEGVTSAASVAQAPRSASGSEPKLEEVSSAASVAQVPKNGGASGSESKPEGAASATDVAQAPRGASGSEPKLEEVSSATSVAQVPKNGGASEYELKSEGVTSAASIVQAPKNGGASEYELKSEGVTSAASIAQAPKSGGASESEPKSEGVTSAASNAQAPKSGGASESEPKSEGITSAASVAQVPKSGGASESELKSEGVTSPTGVAQALKSGGASGSEPKLEEAASATDVAKAPKDGGASGSEPKPDTTPLPYVSEEVSSPTYVAQAPKSGGASGSEPKPEEAASATDVAQAPKDGGASGSEPKPDTTPLPYVSEGVTSPTYVTQGPKNGGTSGSESNLDMTPRTTIEEPSYHGSSAQWEKDETYPTYGTPMPPSEEEKDVLET